MELRRANREVLLEGLVEWTGPKLQSNAILTTERSEAISMDWDIGFTPWDATCTRTANRSPCDRGF